MKKDDGNFPMLLSDFFQKYLSGQRGLSNNTVKAYRDTFVVFFCFLVEKEHIKPENLEFQSMDSAMIERFMEWLEQDRHNLPPTRNHRLAAIHAFIKYVMSRHPEFMAQCRKILDIRSKKTHVKPPVYLSIDELKCILSQPDPLTGHGLRDLALLSLLYDSGCRVQELADLTWLSIRFEKPATITLAGKGNKSRIIPLMPDTANIMACYERSLMSADRTANIFLNKSGHKLSRSGIEYIVEKYAKMAGNTMPSIKEKKITPHVYRHSKGMHLTQADVNIIYIRDLLGHSSVQVTERYARADSRTKREALEKASNNILPESTYSKEEEQELLQFLKTLI